MQCLFGNRLALMLQEVLGVGPQELFYIFQHGWLSFDGLNKVDESTSREIAEQQGRK